MGNINTNVTSGMKAQGDSKSKSLYKYVDLNGGGELVELQKEANRSKQFDKIDEKIRSDEIKGFLYNGGDGMLVDINKLIEYRNRDRGGGGIREKKPGKTVGKSSVSDTVSTGTAATTLSDNDLQMNEIKGKEVKVTDDAEQRNGSVKINSEGAQKKEMCWRLDERGTVGESILHLCLLNATSVHADLAKRLLQVYPKLINDIYVSEEYYGENVLHMAISNEDPAMVKFLLDHGADVHERCCGNFFCPDDQKKTRSDVYDQEWVEVSQETNYDGLYKYVDLNGGGELVELQKEANRSKQFDKIDEKIRSDEIKGFLYNGGDGMLVDINKLIEYRNRDRGGGGIREKKPGKTVGKSSVSDTVSTGTAATTLSDNDLQMNEIKGKEVKVTDDAEQRNGSVKINSEGAQKKEMCWRLDERGTVGESILHLCLLNATSVHADLAKRLLQVYPKLINDIYVSEEYYGENVLHMAISNEDPAMVKFLLDHGADVHERCCGNFFCPDDQKKTRSDVYDQEWVEVSQETNYDGMLYFGEYPLSFAACLGQEECVRLLVAKGADPNLQDTNGNTALHMIVIHDRKNRHRIGKCSSQDMFDLLYNLKDKNKNRIAELHIKNNQGLTPLTLAARLSRKDMYEHILEIEREVYWMYGNVTCANYPLQDIDTIAPDGRINPRSVLREVVYGKLPGHIDMMDGVVANLLDEKWKTFARYRFYRRFLMFFLYYAILVVAFMLRPGADTMPTQGPNGTNITNPCYLGLVRKPEDYARFVFEALTLAGAILYLFLSSRETYHVGIHVFIESLRSAPTKASFLLSCVVIVFLVPGRIACAPGYEDVMAVFAVLLISLYFLFFCRGFKIVGPFVAMIYKMIIGDLLRFFTIYLVFVMGFSQAMYIVYRGTDDPIFSHSTESIMGMIIMSLGEFGDIYDSFDNTLHPIMGKVLFFVYMVLVTVLLVNMLIAMMGNTYTLINSTQKEWLRQKAHIVLVIEQSVTTEERKRQQRIYSQPMGGDRRALVVRWHQSEKEKKELLQLREKHRLQKQSKLARKRDGRILVVSGSTTLNVLEAEQGLVNI
ncbi:transient receptor potential cation channel subfamily V member 5 [Lingula anatina]|uniref:Transient receptor potential cation channel subfamily V member 5 n=1 Tax=Lingula anatina TaxID=7574 RepID=A0A1S3IFS8_LINAN|nr:transient receptor potential cation channel subfamily V member 5 [Lingula anatina]|eukprot:XP_013397110.1 transient receptor potential cation channel subfamily V member 5 [Lingula anatina]